MSKMPASRKIKTANGDVCLSDLRPRTETTRNNGLTRARVLTRFRSKMRLSALAPPIRRRLPPYGGAKTRAG